MNVGLYERRNYLPCIMFSKTRFFDDKCASCNFLESRNDFNNLRINLTANFNKHIFSISRSKHKILTREHVLKIKSKYLSYIHI